MVVPSSPYDAKGLLLAAVEDPDPVIFLEPIRIYRSIKEDVPEEAFTVPIGTAAVERSGTDLSIISYGAMMRESRRAADELEAEGVSVELIDVRSLSPFDAETVVGSVAETGRAVVVHEAHRTGGFGAEIVAQIQEKALYSLLAPVQRVTGYDIVVPLRRAEHHYMPSVARIVAAARKTLEA